MMSFFITVNCKQRGVNTLANPTVWKTMEESVRHRQEQGLWFCSLFLAMPDHIHGLFRFPEDTSIEPSIRD